MFLVVFTSSVGHMMSMSSDRLWPFMDAVLKLLVLVPACAHTDGLELLLSNPTTTPYPQHCQHHNFSIISMATQRCQKLTSKPSTCYLERHCLCHIVSRGLCVVFSFLIVVAVREKGRKRQSDTVREESSFISAADDRGSFCVSIFVPLEESG